MLSGSFTVERELPAYPERVVAMFAKLSLRRQWFFRLPLQPRTSHHELDFRVGGHEVARGTFTGGDAPERLEYRSTFLDIMPERIVFSSELAVNDRCRSASVVIVGFTATGVNTHLTWIEHYVLLNFAGDGRADAAHQRGGIELMLNGLKAVLEHQAAERFVEHPGC